jgi:hypothetical protein
MKSLLADVCLHGQTGEPDMLLDQSGFSLMVVVFVIYFVSMPLAMILVSTPANVLHSMQAV